MKFILKSDAEFEAIDLNDAFAKIMKHFEALKEDADIDDDRILDITSGGISIIKYDPGREE